MVRRGSPLLTGVLLLCGIAHGGDASLEAFLDELWIVHGADLRPCGPEAVDVVELCGRATRDAEEVGATVRDWLRVPSTEADDAKRETVRTERWGREITVETHRRKGKIRVRFSPALPDCGEDPRFEQVGAHDDTPGYEPPVADPSHKVYPAFPAAARLQRTEGRVDVLATIDRDGNVRDLCLVDVSQRGLGFEAAKFDAIRRWRYTPATLDGEVIEVPMTTYSTFDIR